MTAQTPRFRPEGRIVRRPDAEAYAEGRAYLDAAMRKVEEWQARAAEAYEQRRGEGFAEGIREGKEESLRLVAETHRRADAFLASLEPKIEQLVLQMVERIVGTFEGRALVLRLARQGLHRLRHETRLRVLVAPETVASVQADIQRIAAEEVPGALVTVEADPSLAADDCVLASPLGYLRVGLGDQLRALRQGLGIEPAAESPGTER